MKILIVEDDENKRNRLAEFVRESYPESDLTMKNSYQSGLEWALKSGPEIVLLDMSMPTFDMSAQERGGEMRPFAGREMLRHLERKAVSTQVVIVTQFESFGDGLEKMTLSELRAELQARFKGLYVGTVFYQPSEASWRDKLRSAIDKACR